MVVSHQLHSPGQPTEPEYCSFGGQLGWWQLGHQRYDDGTRDYGGLRSMGQLLRQQFVVVLEWHVALFEESTVLPLFLFLLLPDSRLTWERL